MGWLIKTMLSNRLERDVEKFKIEMKADADTEIERIKSFLSRTARVHEQQVDTLMKLYRHLSEAQSRFQNMSSSVRMDGEITDDEYKKLCGASVSHAYDVFLDGQLLIPSELVQQCNKFFTSLFEGQSYLGLAQHVSVIGGPQRAAFWKHAQTAAFDQVPKILAEIENAARDVIHGEPRKTRAEGSDHVA